MNLTSKKDNLKNEKKVAIYIKGSATEQSEHDNNIAKKIEVLKEFCMSHNRQIHDIYIESDITEQPLKDRPTLQKLLSDSENALFNEVLVWDIKSLAATMLDILNIKSRLAKSGVYLKSYTEKIDDNSPEGNLVIQMLGAINEYKDHIDTDDIENIFKARV